MRGALHTSLLAALLALASCEMQPAGPTKEQLFVAECTKGGTHKEECEAVFKLDDCMGWAAYSTESGAKSDCQATFNLTILKLRVRGIRIASDPVNLQVVTPEARPK